MGVERATEKVTLRLSRETLDIVDRQAARLGVTRAAALRYLLLQGLDLSRIRQDATDQRDILERMVDVQERVVRESMAAMGPAAPDGTADGVRGQSGPRLFGSGC